MTAPTVETEAAMDTALIGITQKRKVVEIEENYSMQICDQIEGFILAD